MFINGELPKDEKYPLSCVYWIHTPEMTDPKTQGYVGVSSSGVAIRWGRHTRAADRGEDLPIQHAIRKYRDSILISCLVEADPEFCLLVEEVLRSKPQTGWNVCIGGGKGFLGRNHTEESRKKMSESKNGFQLSATSIKKISDSKTGRVPSEETRKRLSEAQKGKRHSKESRKKMSESSSKWKHAKAGAVWTLCSELFSCYSDNKKISRVSKETKFHRGIIGDMYAHFRDGWNPNEDQEYLSWLEEKKGIE